VGKVGISTCLGVERRGNSSDGVDAAVSGQRWSRSSTPNGESWRFASMRNKKLFVSPRGSRRPPRRSRSGW
jgi:hypothetical protein